MKNESDGKMIDVLMVEDNQDDVELTKEVMRESKIRVNLHVVGDGLEAMEYLKLKGKYENVTRPDLILLDLNLPKLDGRQVLTMIKSDEDLKTIPVVILTSSTAEEDIVKTYKAHCNCYVTKPIGLDQFAKMTKSLEDFWLTIVKYPPRR
jgi:chemotaxis family two-component system response regulator Rcp1